MRTRSTSPLSKPPPNTHPWHTPLNDSRVNTWQLSCTPPSCRGRQLALTSLLSVAGLVPELGYALLLRSQACVQVCGLRFAVCGLRLAAYCSRFAACGLRLEFAVCGLWFRVKVSEFPDFCHVGLHSNLERPFRGRLPLLRLESM